MAKTVQDASQLLSQSLLRPHLLASRAAQKQKTRCLKMWSLQPRFSFFLEDHSLSRKLVKDHDQLSLPHS